MVNSWLAGFCTGITSTHLDSGAINGTVGCRSKYRKNPEKRIWPGPAVSIAQSHPGSSRGHHCHPDKDVMTKLAMFIQKLRWNSVKTCDEIQSEQRNKTWQASLPPSLCPAHTCQHSINHDKYIFNTNYTTKRSEGSLLPSLCTMWAWCLWPCARPHSLQCLWQQPPLPVCLHNNLLIWSTWMQRIQTWRIFGRSVVSGSVAPQPATHARCPTEKTSESDYWLPIKWQDSDINDWELLNLSNLVWTHNVDIYNMKQ